MIVTLPVELMVELVVIELDVSIVVAPVISDVLLIVPALIIGLVRVFDVKVPAPFSVTIVPEVGKTAVDEIPVPPKVAGSMPVTDAAVPRLTALNDGAPPPLGTVNIWPAVPAVVALRAPVPPPIMTPLLVKLTAPVPPTATPKVPDVMMLAVRFGKSDWLSVNPAMIRPLVSTPTLVKVPAEPSSVVNVGFG